MITMTSTELHKYLYAKASEMATAKGLVAQEPSFKQNFLLGSLMENPDNLVQEQSWTKNNEKVEFRHRFDNICISVKKGEYFAEVEYNIDKETGEAYIAETMTFRGRESLKMLDKLLDETEPEQLATDALYDSLPIPKSGKDKEEEEQEDMGASFIEFLQEKGAFEAFIQNCPHEYLKGCKGIERNYIFSALAWTFTKEGSDYWQELHREWIARFQE